MKRKTNNRGFTLVELIIAVAILAIVILPLISNFIQSSKMNLKGRKSLNAMNLAQDVMEGMSAFTASEVDEKMVAATGATPTDLAGVVLPVGTTYSGVAKDPSSNADKKIYTLTNVQTATGNHNAYDMTITVDGSSSNHAEFNDYSTADITKVDQYLDAVFTLDDDEYVSAVNQLKLASSDQSKGVSDYEDKMKREINIMIQDEGTTTPKYTVKVDRTYKVDDSTDYAALGFAAAPSYTYSSNNLSFTEEDELPRSLYFYYEALPWADDATTLYETINITNTTGEDFTVYLIRTRKDYTPVGGTTESIPQNVKDLSKDYRCRVNIVSQDPAGNPTENVDIVSNLRHDICRGLKDNLRIYKEGSTTEYVDAVDELKAELGEDSSTGNPNVPSDYGYSAARAEYYYNSTTSTMSEADYLAHVSDGYSKKTENILYEVTLEIKEHGKSDVVATYTGGISE